MVTTGSIHAGLVPNFKDGTKARVSQLKHDCAQDSFGALSPRAFSWCIGRQEKLVSYGAYLLITVLS